MIIIFEGSDYTGKTTLSKKLSKVIGVPRLCVNFHDMKRAESDLDLQEYSAVSFGTSLGIVESYNLFHNGVIRDRSYLTEYVYSKLNINGSRETREGFFKTWIERLKENDYIFILLESDLDDIAKRMKELDDGDIEIEEIGKVKEEYLKVLEENDLNYLRIDTSKSDIDKCLMDILWEVCYD